MTLSPREYGEFIARRAQHLRINDAGIGELSKEVVWGLLSGKLSLDREYITQKIVPKSEDPYCINWLFVSHVIGLVRWIPREDAIGLENRGNPGYLALCKFLNRAKAEGFNISDPHYYSKITGQDLEWILRADDERLKLCSTEERVQDLHECGRKLIDNYNGSFDNCVKQCDKSAQKLLQLIVEEFPQFREEIIFEGQRVGVYSKAQRLIGEIWTSFKGQGLGEFKDIDTLTVSPEYRIPQVLVYFGALVYNDELMEKLRRDYLFHKNDREILEIQGATIHIVEKLKEQVLIQIREKGLNILLTKVNCVTLDTFLWNYRLLHNKKIKELNIPFYKIKIQD